MDLIRWLDLNGGIAHVDDLVRAGFTRYRIRNAVAASLVHRVRRSWMCTMSAPPLLERAASISGRLACVSAARHHGLRTLSDDDDEHIPNRTHLSATGSTDSSASDWSTKSMGTGSIARRSSAAAISHTTEG
jgi:hypothetical protein